MSKSYPSSDLKKEPPGGSDRASRSRQKIDNERAFSDNSSASTINRGRTMKIFLLLLVLVQLSLQQEWTQSPLFQSTLDFSVASNERRTLVVFTTPRGIEYSSSPFTNSIEISNGSSSHPILRVLNDTWILAFINNQYINILRMTEENFGVWDRVLHTPASDRMIALHILYQASADNIVTALWANPLGRVMFSRSYDDGLKWTTFLDFPFVNSSSLSPSTFINYSSCFVMDLDPYFYLATFTIDGFEILFSSSTLSIIYNTTGTGHPQVAVDNQSILFLSGSGDLVVSNDQGANWSSPIRLVPGSLTLEQNGTWLLLGLNSTVFQSRDGGRTWTSQEIGQGPIDKIAGSSSQILALRNESLLLFTPSPPSPLPQIVLLNESLLITTPILLNRSLVVEGTLSVGSQLQIEGDLALTENSTLDLTNWTSPIEVSGTFIAGGHLVLPKGTGTVVLIQFNSSRGNFSQISGPRCSRLEYAESSLVVFFDSSCTEPAIQLWMIIVIVVASVVAVAIAVVLFVFFRKKIAPYHDRKHYVPSRKQQVT